MVTQRDIDVFGDLWALLYCIFAREMVDSFGEKGEEALIRAIKAYGVARGARLREIHKSKELPINLRSLFEHYDLPGHSGTKKTRKVFDDNKLVSYTYKCPFQGQWRERGCINEGKLYCQYFHHAFWQEYRHDLDVQLPEILTTDDPHCLFIVTQPKD